MPWSASTYCSSSPVPSVATASAWVSPRVNSALPWVRGRMPTSQTIGLTVRQVAPVDALLGVEDARADDVLLGLLEGARHFAGHACRRRRPGTSAATTLLLDGGDAVAALMLGGDGISLAQLRLGERRARARPVSPSSLGLSSQGSLAARSASLTMASSTGWKCFCPYITAPSMMSSDSSLASDSTISTASAVPATTRSSALSGISSIIGFSTYWPPI